jgi:hypothetical protein
MTPQELNHGSPRKNQLAIPDVDEPTSKDLIDGDRILTLQALTSIRSRLRHGVTTMSSQENSMKGT